MCNTVLKYKNYFPFKIKTCTKPRHLLSPYFDSNLGVSKIFRVQIFSPRPPQCINNKNAPILCYIYAPRRGVNCSIFSTKKNCSNQKSKDQIDIYVL